MLCPAPDDFAASVLEVRRRQHPVGAFKRTFVFRWTACTGFAFRTFVDPLLWTEYRLQGILASVLSAMAAPLSAVRAGLLTEALVIYRQIAIPLQMVYRQVCGSLANKVYHF